MTGVNDVPPAPVSADGALGLKVRLVLALADKLILDHQVSALKLRLNVARVGETFGRDIVMPRKIGARRRLVRVPVGMDQRGARRGRGHGVAKRLGLFDLEHDGHRPRPGPHRACPRRRPRWALRYSGRRHGQRAAYPEWSNRPSSLAHRPRLSRRARPASLPPWKYQAERCGRQRWVSAIAPRESPPPLRNRRHKTTSPRALAGPSARATLVPNDRHDV